MFKKLVLSIYTYLIVVDFIRKVNILEDYIQMVSSGFIHSQNAHALKSRISLEEILLRFYIMKMYYFTIIFLVIVSLPTVTV